MFSESKVTDIYCIADDSCKEFALQQGKYMVEDKEHKHCNKSNRMNDTKIIVILILFYSDGFRCFKHYYKEYVCKHLTHLFPDRVSYNRLVELEKEVAASSGCLYQESPVGNLYGHQFCRFHPPCVSAATNGYWFTRP